MNNSIKASAILIGAVALVMSSASFSFDTGSGWGQKSNSYVSANYRPADGTIHYNVYRAGVGHMLVTHEGTSHNLR